MALTTEPRTTRRDRLRAETTREIKSLALAQLTADGAGAISLRGIAREMGMTARAIYSYFATRDDLVTALVEEINTSLADALERARDEAADPGARLFAWGIALREWALANPAGFRLVYGDPIPGYRPPVDGPAERAARRVCGGLNRLVAELCPDPVEPVGSVEWSHFPADYVAKVRAEAPEISPAVAALALRVWGRIHGLVTLEVYGQLRSVSNDPAALQRADLLDLVEQLRAQRVAE
ncbi:TetR/AcrR family transcriptional regulator [Nocardia sp. CDC159]|uniref:TetR/AcrR family transcriptional regulator n=1 Tax=Nocardia pulmonis TaxID=2951408 RepID=A0A9X2IZH6_9NOCA|nr:MULTISPECIES: TetR/AcrR family transcriptional regulator [Nocardia]MCM6776754.1 TetR/AcrR family transcriptional regulator [Nocardia pulmonis]MCM6789097.1 TetR/AcrR family transcriptional regulator [Nocardia sp. CDC159]